MQIINLLKKGIVTGVLAPGSRLDSVRALSEVYEVNLNTMQRACAELERQGAIHTQRGIGSFVTEDPILIRKLATEMSEVHVDYFVKGMRSIGCSEAQIIELVRKALEK